MTQIEELVRILNCKNGRLTTWIDYLEKDNNDTRLRQ